MTQEWFVAIGGVVEGPLSDDQIKNDVRLNPGVLVWRPGFGEWQPIGLVSEFSDLFEEDKSSEEEKEEPSAERPKEEKESANEDSEREPETAVEKGHDKEFIIEDDEVLLEFQEEPPIFKFWLIVLLVVLTYIFYHFYFIL